MATTTPTPLDTSQGKKPGHLDLGDYAEIEIQTQQNQEYELEFTATSGHPVLAWVDATQVDAQAATRGLTATGGKFEARGNKVAVSVEEAGGAAFAYDVEVKPAAVLLQPGSPQWENGRIAPGDAVKYRIPAGQNREYLLYMSYKARRSSRRVETAAGALPRVSTYRLDGATPEVMVTVSLSASASNPMDYGLMVRELV